MDRTLSMVIVSFVLGALVSITIQACGGDENKFEQDCGSGNSTSSANCECSWDLRIWLIMKFVMKMVRLVIVGIMFMTIKGEW